MADVEAGEFWGFFGGFAPLPRKAALGEARNEEASPGKLLWYVLSKMHECIIFLLSFSDDFFYEYVVFLSVDKGETTQVESDSLTRELLETNKCYLLDCGIEIYVWVGKSTSLEERKSAVTAAEVITDTFLTEVKFLSFLHFAVLLNAILNVYYNSKQELLNKTDQPKAHVIRVTEGSETVMFCSKFDSWPQQAGVTAPEEGRGKVAGQYLQNKFICFKHIVSFWHPRLDRIQ